MSVGTFDPNAKDAPAEPLGADDRAQLLTAAAQLDATHFGLDEVTVARLAPLATTDGADWPQSAKSLDAVQLEGLVRLFTLAESRLPGWEAGAKSPVVPLVRELKQRNAYPTDLNAWIKANTRNRFLPYGSLLDRL